MPFFFLKKMHFSMWTARYLQYGCIFSKKNLLKNKGENLTYLSVGFRFLDFKLQFLARNGTSPGFITVAVTGVCVMSFARVQKLHQELKKKPTLLSMNEKHIILMSSKSLFWIDSMQLYHLMRSWHNTVRTGKSQNSKIQVIKKSIFIQN